MPPSLKKPDSQRFLDGAFLAQLDGIRLLCKRRRVGRPGRTDASVRLGDGLEPAEHRSYQPGDDPRYIDWPYLARSQRLTVRRFHEHSESDLAVLLDASASMAADDAPGVFDHARRLAAGLAYIASAGGRNVRAFAMAETLRPLPNIGRDRRRIGELLRELSQLQTAGRCDLPQCVRNLPDRARRAGIFVLISDLCDTADALPRVLGELATNGCDVLVLHTYPQPMAPKGSGPVVLRCAETDRPLRTTLSREVLTALAQRQADAREQTRLHCRRAGAVYQPAPTATAAPTLLRRALAAANLLAE